MFGEELAHHLRRGQSLTWRASLGTPAFPKRLPRPRAWLRLLVSEPARDPPGPDPVRFRSSLVSWGSRVGAQGTAGIEPRAWLRRLKMGAPTERTEALIAPTMLQPRLGDQSQYLGRAPRRPLLPVPEALRHSQPPGNP